MKNRFLKNEGKGKIPWAISKYSWLPRLYWRQALIPVSYCFVVSMLCGCSTTSETFDCKAGQGVGCKSISEVNQMVDQQTLGKETEIGKLPQLPNQPISFPAPIITSHPLETKTSQISIASNPSEVSLSETLTVQRMPEKYLRVWIAPFQDGHGNLHEGSVIHTILKPSYWHLTPTLQNDSIFIANNSNGSKSNNEESKDHHQSDTPPSSLELGEDD